MNPLTNTKNQAKMNKRELELNMSGTVASWHYQFKDSAWIFVGGLNYDLTEGDVITVFSQYGEVVNINLVRDKVTGKAKGFAFICYENQQSTILAVDNFNGIKLLGRTIRVDHVKDYKMPKDDEEDDDEIRKLVRREGCAPDVNVEKKSKKVNKQLKIAREARDEHMNMQCNSVLKGNEEDWSQYSLKEKEGARRSNTRRNESEVKQENEGQRVDEHLDVEIKKEKNSSDDEYGNNITKAINSVREKIKKEKDDDDDVRNSKRKSDDSIENPHDKKRLRHYSKSSHCKDANDSDDDGKRKESGNKRTSREENLNKHKDKSDGGEYRKKNQDENYEASKTHKKDYKNKDKFSEEKDDKYEKNYDKERKDKKKDDEKGYHKDRSYKSKDDKDKNDKDKYYKDKKDKDKYYKKKEREYKEDKNRKHNSSSKYQRKRRSRS